MGTQVSSGSPEGTAGNMNGGSCFIFSPEVKPGPDANWRGLAHQGTRKMIHLGGHEREGKVLGLT